MFATIIPSYQVEHWLNKAPTAEIGPVEARQISRSCGMDTAKPVAFPPCRDIARIHTLAASCLIVSREIKYDLLG